MVFLGGLPQTLGQVFWQGIWLDATYDGVAWAKGGDGGSDGDSGGESGGGSDGDDGDRGSDHSDDDGDRDDGGRDDGDDSHGSGASGAGGRESLPDDGRQKADRKAGVIPGVLAEFGAKAVRVLYSDGSSATLRAGMLEQRDARGALKARASAAADDRARIEAMPSNIRSPARAGGAVAVIEADGRTARVTDAQGWTETLRNGVYVLIDPNGNTVTRRPASAEDVARVQAFLRP